MSHALEYQECYRKPAHTSTINIMILSPDGDRLVTGSDDCTVRVWSTQTGSILCHIQTRNPVISLAWITNSNGFFVGCESGYLVIVELSEQTVKVSSIKAHVTATCKISPSYNDVFPISAASNEVKIWTRCTGSDHPHGLPSAERWDLKVKLPSPNISYRQQEVEVTSVNWATKDAAAAASQVLVSYRWHGIIRWDLKNMTILSRLPIGECAALSLSSDGRCAATFAPSQYFEVRDFKTGLTQRMQVPILPTSTAGHRKKPLALKNHPICFAHGGLAVAGALNENQLHVWDAERGDLLLSLDHGEGSKVCSVVTTSFSKEDKILIATGAERHGKYYVFLWLTAPRSGGDTAHTFAGQRVEHIQLIQVPKDFWTGFSLIALVLLALSFALRVL